MDDTALVVGGTTDPADGFEGATRTWTVRREPAGSPPNGGNWVIGGQR